MVDGHVRLNGAGHVVVDIWRWLTVQYPYVTLDEWCVMPDHLHGILVLGGSRTGDTVTTDVDAPHHGSRTLVGGSRTGVGGAGTGMGGSRTGVGGSRTLVGGSRTGDTVTTGVDAPHHGLRTLVGGSRTRDTVTTDVDAPHHGSRTLVGGSRTGDTVTTDVDAPILRRRKPIGGLVGAFKTVSTKRINALRNTPGAPVWQRDFWDHVVRNDSDLRRIRAYIRDNARL
jgi:hypothetical protein